MRFIQMREGEHGPPRSCSTRLWRYLFMVVVACGFVLPNQVKADSVEITFLGITSAGAGLWDWHYRARLTPDNYVSSGDTVTIYDFEGFTGVASFTAVPALSGPAYSLTSSNDVPVQPGFPGETPPPGDLPLGDILFTYSGTSPYRVVGSSAPGDTVLGDFALRSTVATGALDVVQTFDTSVGPNGIVGGGDDVANMVIRLTTVPRSGGFPPPGAVPLPLSVCAGSALIGMVAVRRSKGGQEAI